MTNKDTHQDASVEAAEDLAETQQNEAPDSSTLETSAEETIEDIQQGQLDISILQAELEKAQQEAADAKDQAIRAVAESQNIRRRAAQDVEKAHKFALEKFVNDMLPVADNLERAIESSNAEGAEIKTLVEGVELTLKSLVSGLERHNVEQINPEGQPFNPEIHQAMTMVEDPNVEPNSVVNVFQKGYTLSGRLVRPAMVVVSKAP